MILDSLIVALALAGAVAFLVWRSVPRRNGAASPCGACRCKAPARSRGAA